MREPAEAGNHVEMAAGLAHGMPVERLQTPRRLVGDPLRHGHDASQPFHVVRTFRVAEGQEEERLLPGSGQGVVVAVSQALLGDPERVGIDGIGLGRAREQAARELVEDDDQRQPSEGVASQWSRRPVLAASSTGANGGSSALAPPPNHRTNIRPWVSGSASSRPGGNQKS